jgi:hypothetical protein
MQLFTALGVALYSIGPGPEAKAAWSEVLEIAESLDDTDHLLRALWGLWVVCVTGGKHRPGLSLARRFTRIATRAADSVALLVGERLIGTSLHFLGEHANGKRHIERTLDDSLASNSRTHIIRFQFDQSVSANAYLARILWLQGYPDQARRAAERSVAQAQALNHSLSLCYALGSAACPIALLVHGLAVDRRHFPAAEHAERVGKRPVHCRGDLAGDAHRQRANVLMLDRKCERPFLLKHRELLACFLGAAISLDPIWRCHARSHASK